MQFTVDLSVSSTNSSPGLNRHRGWTAIHEKTIHKMKSFGPIVKIKPAMERADQNTLITMCLVILRWSESAQGHRM